MARFVVDGNLATGHYRGFCSCTLEWDGAAEALNGGGFSPALPIAEAVSHYQMGHAPIGLHIEFTAAFRDWLVWYWQRHTQREADRLMRESAVQR